MSDDKEKDPYQGVPIQRLPTMGRAISYRTWKQGHRPGVPIKVNTQHKKKIEQIAAILAQKEKND